MKRTEQEWEDHEFRLESELQKYCLKRLKEKPDTMWFKTNDRFTSGISDIIGSMYGVFVAIELKVGKNQPTPLQTLFLGEVAKTGGFACVARTWGEVKNLLEEVRYYANRGLDK